jgi:uncharacterized protein (TIRG00374 family)
LSFNRWFLTLGSFALAVGASAYVVASTWPSAGGRVWLPATSHLLAALAVALEVLVRSLKIELSGRALGVPLSLRTCARVCLGGDFGAAVTPSRSGAEPARFLVLSEARVPAAGALMVLFTELFLELLSIAAVAAGLALVFRGAGPVLAGIAGLVGGYALFVFGLGAAGLALARRRHARRAPPWLERIGVRGARWAALRGTLEHLHAGAAGLRGARLVPMAGALVMSVLHVALRVAVLPALVLPAAAGTAAAPLVLWPLALIYGGVVAPAPGGGGVVEVAFKHALGPHIPEAVFGAALVWWRFYTFYLYILLGGLVAGGTVVRAIRARGRRDEGTPAAAEAA